MNGSQLKELLILAQSKSSESRSRLVENITDLFLSDQGRLSEHERALMSDILSKLIGQVEADIRRELAEALVKSGVDFPDVAKMLSNDEIEIARPLLERSKLLTDPDLIEVIRMRTDEHRMSITMREELSESVTNALIEYGGDDVIESLLNNHDAAISSRAMEYLVSESRRVDRFQEPLIRRSDLPGDLAYRMYWWVSAALRKQIISEFDIDPVVLEQAVKRAAKAVMVDKTSEDSAYVKAQKLVRRMHENGELSIQFLINALRQQRIAVFVAGLAELANVEFQTAWRVFADRGGESFAILAKAVGIDRSQFTSIFLLVSQAREGGTVKSPGFLKDILALFDSITEDNAKGALQVWQRDMAYQAAIEELEKTG
ncbi:hypothetical protein GCM10017044_19800 [Kordiimonas sediminis]|uniref:DUF2336 domain-containing protein n=1 Tax=Kordiimonas sediminis TaxID=1735581 RepID=A0A919ATU0_9PROT|nr:DUF2336 domain-containing protein [Kordiimonas sediminis]GHF25063.1 hypothetical protein GCM10017044_19800 [Kordiimonas sediminis]